MTFKTASCNGLNVTGLICVALLFLTGCSGGLKSVSDAEITDRIANNLIEEFKKVDLPFDINGKPYLTKESQDALAELRVAMAAEGFSGTVDKNLKIEISAQTTKPSYKEVSESEAFTDREEFDKARALATQLRLRTPAVPQMPHMVKVATPAGSKFKILYTVRATFRIDQEDKKIVVSSLNMRDFDFEGLDGNTFDLARNIVLLGSSEGDAVLERRTAYINAINEATAALEKEKEEQKQREIKMEEAVNKALAAFDGRYNVQLQHPRNDSVVDLSFYFTVDVNGGKAIKFETVGDPRNLERNFRVNIQENRAKKEFLEDGAAHAVIEASTRSTTSYRATESRDFPSFFRGGASGVELIMTSDTRNPGQLLIRGSYSGVAKRVE